LLSLKQAKDADRRLIRKGIWVRRRRDGSNPWQAPGTSSTL
jgi:hypothetical protein